MLPVAPPQSGGGPPGTYHIPLPRLADRASQYAQHDTPPGCRDAALHLLRVAHEPIRNALSLANSGPSKSQWLGSASKGLDNDKLL